MYIYIYIYIVVNPYHHFNSRLSFQLTPYPNPQSLCHSLNHSRACSHAQEYASLCHSLSHTASVSLTLKHHCPSSKLSASHRRSKLSTPLIPSQALIAGLFSTSLQFFFLKCFIITFLCKSKNQRKPIVFLSIS